MLHAIQAWLLAGSPAHYMTMLGVFAYACLEWWLPRTQVFKANSTLELGANAAKKALLDKIPLLGRLVKALATPAALVLLSLTLGGCDWRPVDANTGMTLLLICGAGGMAVTLARTTLQRLWLLVIVCMSLLAPGCAGLKAQAKADGITATQLALQDIAKDAPDVGACLFKTAATAGAIYAGNLAVIATGVPTDLACFYDAIKEILAQLATPSAVPLTPAAITTAQSAHRLIKAALSLKPVQ